ncbi:hypothetical protein YB2330_006007 [Saitoella coloradoensis]
MSSCPRSQVRSFWNDKTVLLTGATGNLGLAFLAKILHNTSVKRIYAVVRGAGYQARLMALWEKHLPDTPWDERIVAIEGDMSRRGLGLGKSVVETLRKEVEIIVHMAADINLRSTIPTLFLTNVEGSLTLALVASTFPKLALYIHTSTSYVNANLPNLSQRFGAPPMSWEAWPFSYAYTKHLCERILTKRMKDAGTLDRLLINHPAVVGPSFTAPYPMYEIPGSTPTTSLLLMELESVAKARAKGIVAPAGQVTGFSNGRNIFDEVPTDIVVNITIAHGAYGTRGVVHASASHSNGACYREIFDEAFGYMSERDYSPGGVHHIRGIMGIFKLCGMEWMFRDDRTRELLKRMTNEDLRDFNPDVRLVDMKRYHRDRTLKWIKVVKAEVVRKNEEGATLMGEPITAQGKEVEETHRPKASL